LGEARTVARSKSILAGYWRGWNIVAFTFAVQFVVFGTAYYAFGVYLKHLPEHLDTSRFYVSLALTAQTVMIGLASPAVSRALAARSLRGLMTTGVLLMGLGFLWLSFADRLWQLYAAFGVLVSAGLVMLAPVPANALIANWFERKRGTALGISQFGLTISGSALVPLTTWLILEHGLAFTFRLYAVAIPVILLPLIWRYAIRAPEDVGLLPDGDAAGDEQTPPGSADFQPWTVRRALSDRDVWTLTLTIGPGFVAIATILITLPAYGTDSGFTDMQAAGVVFVATLLGAFAKPLFGTLADFYNTKWVVGVSLALQALGVSLLLVATTYNGLLLAGLAFGLGYGAMAPLWSVMMGELFGRQAFASVMGAMSPIIMPFNVIGPPVANLVFERSGSYAPAYAVLLFGYAVSFVALWRLRLGKPT